MTPELTIQDHVATITLRRPKQANRLDPVDLSKLINQIAEVNAHDDVLVLRLQAQGKYFCSGSDITQIGDDGQVGFDQMVDALEDARPVTLAVIQGGTYGGATDMALACDFRVGSREVEMFMPAARLGLHFYQRGMERYVSRLGINMAKRLFLTAEKINAEQMHACGFLTHLVEADALAATADELTHTLAGMAPLALLGMKKHLTRIARGMLDPADLQRDIARAAQSADLKEGAAAWAAKRPARFSGH